MSTFRAFQTGLAAGQEQRKYRDENDARTQAADAFKSGNFEGAVAPLMRVGLMQEADAYGQAGQRKQETEQTQTYAKAYQTGLGAGPAPSKKITQPPAGMAPETGMVPPPTGLGQGPTPQPQQPNVRGGIEGVRAAAAARGDFETVAKMDEMIANVDKSVASMSEQQRADFKDGMEFLGQTAMNLKGVPPEARGQAAMEILQNSPYANPQILQQIQQAAMDGRITDEELDNFAMQSMSVADRVKMNQPKTPSYSVTTTRDGVLAYNTSDPTQTVPLGQAPLPASQQGTQEGYRPATPEEKQAYGFAPDAAVSINTLTGKPDLMGTPKQASDYSATEVRNFRDKADGLYILDNAISQYVQTLERMGGPQLLDTPLNAENVQAIRSAHGLITAAMKEAESLGALDAGVQNLVNSIISDPVGWGTIGKSTKSIKAQAEEIGKGIDFKLSRIPEEFRLGSTGAAPPQVAPNQPQPFNGSNFDAPPPPGLPPQAQQAWAKGTPAMRKYAWDRMSPAQKASAMGGQAPAAPQAPAASDLGDDELRAMLGL